MTYFDQGQRSNRLPKILHLCFLLVFLGCQSNFNPSLLGSTAATGSSSGSTDSSGSSGSSGSSSSSGNQDPAPDTSNQIPANYFGLTVHRSSLVPVVKFGTVRSWDASPYPDWADSNPAPGVYKWAALDAFLAANQATASTPARDIIYTLGRTPRWASSQPNAPTDYGPGQCAPPSDIANWDNYVTAVATHANGAIKYWEIWNEPMNSRYYCGDIATMVTLAQHARKIIKSIVPDAVILSPATGNGWGPPWLASFLLQGGAPTVDVIAFHGYWSQTAEDLLTLVNDYKTVMAQNGVSDLPLWDTEASGGTATIDAKSAFLSKYYLLHFSLGVSRFLWYGYDGSAQWGELWNQNGGPNQAATAYAQTYDWMVGANLTSPCAKGSNGVWTCGLSRANYQSMALWNSTGPSTVTVLSQFVQYRDLQGTVHPITDGTVTVGNSPILVETAATQSASLAFASIAPQNFGGPPLPVFASSPSNGAITYSVLSGPATLAGAMITFTSAGTVTLQASQAASGNYVASTATTSFNVNPIAPTMAFGTIAPETFGTSPFPVTVKSPSSGPITYSVVSGPAALSGPMVQLTGGGMVTIAANQAAAGGYTAGTTTTSFSVGAGVTRLAFAPIDSATFGDAPIALSANSASDGAITYSVINGGAAVSGSMLTITGAGTVSVKAKQAATASYAASTAQISFNVSPAEPTFSFATIPDQIFGNTVYGRLTSNSNGIVTLSVVSGSATVSGNAITSTGVGTVRILATKAAMGNYTSKTATTSFNVTAKTPTLKFDSIANQTYGGTALTVNATSASTALVSYTVVSGPATASGSKVTFTGAGWVKLSATQAAGGNYTSATTATTFNVVGAAQTLTFAPIDQQSYGSLPFKVSASSQSTGGITYTVTGGPATVSGSTLTLTGIGSVTLGATQAARGNYGPATATTSFKVVSGAATLSFAKIAGQTFGNPAFIVSATSASKGPVEYSVVSGPARVSGSTVIVTGAGTVVLGASQTADGAYSAGTATTSFVVAPGTPVLSFAAIAPQTFGNPPAALNATSASDGAVTYSVSSGPATVSGSNLTSTGSGTVWVLATQAATPGYKSATAKTSLFISPIAPTLNIASIPDQVFGNTVYSKLISNSKGSVSYSILSGPATVSGNAIKITGVGTVEVMATQAALGNYVGGSSKTSFNVSAKTPTLSFAAIPAVSYGNAAITVGATSASSAPVTYSVTTGPATVSGSTVTLTGSGWVKLNAVQTADINYNGATTAVSFYVGKKQ